ncbi:MAG: segregation ATPase FtsK/SpoIIIE, family, partial [Gaiellales bacterium]|nr:segregation ATPase FtsK/SpoIIIE, family [Gaiellales bacterium]
MVQGPSGRARHIAVDSAPDAALGDLARVLAERFDVRPGDGSHPLAIYCERVSAWLPNDEQIGASGLRQGDRITVGPRARMRSGKPVHAAAADLAVVSGPLAGTTLPLSDGTQLVGRDAGCDVVLDEPSVSREHFLVEVAHGKILLEDAGSRNGVEVDGERLGEHQRVELSAGQTVTVGRNGIQMRPRPAGRSADVETVDGWVPFNRPPRRTQPFQAPTFRIAAPPPDPPRPRLPFAAALIPLIGGIGLYLVMRATGQASPAVLLFSALSPLMVVGSAIEDSRRGKGHFRRESAAFQERLEATEREISAARDAESQARHAAAPGVTALCDRAVALTDEVWERRPADADFLDLRIGLADQPSRVVVTVDQGGNEELRRRAEAVRDLAVAAEEVPVCVSPLDGAVAVVGTDEPARMMVRWLLLQAAILHSPRDLTIAAAVPADSVDDWSWLKWLPHTRPEG